MPRRDENYNDMLSRLFATEGENEHVVTATLQVTDACNLRCTYCYQINKHTNRMSFETGRKFIDMLLSETGLKTYYDGKSTTGIILEFIGGEPLLEIDLIDQLTDYFISEMIRLRHPLLNRYRISICSNGVLYFDERVQRYIKKHLRHLSFSISIDGNKELHDACRVFPDGSGSYDIAMKGVRHFVDVLGGNMGSKMTLAPQNISHTFEAVKGLIDSGYKEIHLNCVYEEGWTAEHAKILYDQLKKLADYMVDNDLTEEIYVAMFEQDFFRPKREDDLKNWCGGNGEMISCDYKGDIYPCIRYMESSLGTDVPPLIVGNLETGVLVTPEQRKCMDCLRCIDRRSQSTDECFNCPIAEGCSWCFPAGTQVLTPEGMRNIETLRAGDKVIDGDGAERSVTVNMSRTVWKDELTFVKAAGFPATLVTKEHPFWAKPVVKRRFNVPIYGEPRWVPAKDLKPSDKIALFVPARGHNSISPETAYILGRYIGDGWKTPSQRVAHPFKYCLCCSHGEEMELDRRLEAAKVAYSKHIGRTVVEYSLCISGHEDLFKLIDDCGRYAGDKHIPAAVWSWDDQSVKALLEGYFDSDGSTDRKLAIQRYTSISKRLIYEVALLVKSVYKKPVNITQRKFHGGTGYIEGRKVHMHDSYEGRFQLSEPRKVYAQFEDDGYIWASVSSCGNPLPDQETVYNLTVDGTHTYIANGAVVHNCTAYNYQVFGTPDKRATYICIMHKARALANAYFWNKKFRKEGSHKRMKLWIPEDWALEIINKEEWNLLKKMEGI